MAFDGSHQDRARTVSRTHLVNVGAGIEEGGSCLNIAFPHSVQESSETALGTDEARITRKFLRQGIFFFFRHDQSRRLHLSPGTDSGLNLVGIRPPNTTLSTLLDSERL